MKKNLPRDGENVGGEHDIERRSADLQKRHIVCEDAHEKLGEEGFDEQEGDKNEKSQTNDFPNQRKDFIHSPLPHQITDQRAGSGRKGDDGHEGNGRKVANDVGGSKVLFAEMLHGKEEEEPGGKREEVLKHRPDTDVQEFAQHRKTKVGETVQTVACAIHFREGVDDEEKQGDEPRHSATDGGAGDTKSGATEVAEDEAIVEKDVGNHENDGVERQDTGFRGGNIERTKHGTAESKENSADSPVQIVVRGFKDTRRVDDLVQKQRCELPREKEKHQRKHKKEDQTVVEDAADAQIFSLAVATRHQDLRTDAETETEHEDGDVEDAPQGGGSEFNLTDSSEEGGVGHADELLHEGAQKNRIGDGPDLRVFVGGRHDAAREMEERKDKKRAARETGNEKAKASGERNGGTKRQKTSGERNGGTKKARSERREKRKNEKGKKRATREMEERKRQKTSGKRNGGTKRQKTSGERRNGSSSSPLVKVLSGAVPHFSN